MIIINDSTNTGYDIPELNFLVELKKNKNLSAILFKAFCNENYQKSDGLINSLLKSSPKSVRLGAIPDQTANYIIDADTLQIKDCNNNKTLTLSSFINLNFDQRYRWEYDFSEVIELSLSGKKCLYGINNLYMKCLDTKNETEVHNQLRDFLTTERGLLLFNENQQKNIREKFDINF